VAVEPVGALHSPPIGGTAAASLPAADPDGRFSQQYAARAVTFAIAQQLISVTSLPAEPARIELQLVEMQDDGVLAMPS